MEPSCLFLKSTLPFGGKCFVENRTTSRLMRSSFRFAKMANVLEKIDMMGR